MPRQVLYKFRDWSNEFNRRLIVERELYLSNNYSFNDPFDLQLPVLITGKPKFDEKLFIEDYNNMKGRVPNPSEIKQAKLMHPKLELSQAELEFHRVECQSAVREIEKRLGVFCLSKRNDSSLMWGHYSNSHYGFCVGLDSEKLNKYLLEHHSSYNGLQEVTYKSKIPSLDLSLFDDEYVLKQAKERFILKFDHWMYEDEIRIIIDNMAKKTIVIPPDIFVEMIFGYKMGKSQEKEIRIICKELYPNMKYYKAEPNLNKFEMNIIPC